MIRSWLFLFVLPAAVLGLAAQAQAPRTPWGDPDLQGKWSNATLTPLQRPAELGDKQFFTEDEAKAYVRQRIAAQSGDANIEADRSAGNVGSYNDAWMDRGTDVVPTRRTSLIIEPENGKVPPFTAAAQSEHERNLAHAAAHPADTPEDRYLTERCIGFGGGHAPMLPEPYNNNYYIVQTPDYVTIMAELNHEVRIIPIDGRPHLPGRVRQWTGDSRGRFEGDTLVIETTNLRASRNARGSAEQMKLTERFTRVDAGTLHYQFTVDDPATYVKSWTAMIPMKPAPGTGRIYEFACHEGNHGMLGILAGHRAQEKASAPIRTSSR